MPHLRCLGIARACFLHSKRAAFDSPRKRSCFLVTGVFCLLISQLFQLFKLGQAEMITKHTARLGRRFAYLSNCRRR
jgi:hypothetical protein